MIVLVAAVVMMVASTEAVVTMVPRSSVTVVRVTATVLLLDLDEVLASFELLTISVVVLVEVSVILPEDFASTKLWMEPPCGVTVIMLPLFFVFDFFADGSFAADSFAADSFGATWNIKGIS